MQNHNKWLVLINFINSSSKKFISVYIDDENKQIAIFNYFLQKLNHLIIVTVLKAIQSNWRIVITLRRPVASMETRKKVGALFPMMIHV